MQRADDTVQIDVNGRPVAVLVAAPARVVFECPDMPVGSELSIQLRNNAGMSNSVRTTITDFSPGVFTVEGSTGSFGQIVRRDSVDLSVSALGISGKPATPGDIVSIFCTGLGHAFESGGRISTAVPRVEIQGLVAETLSAVPIGRGVYRVDVRIPEGLSALQRATVKMDVAQMNGEVIHAEVVHISIAQPAGK
jgi:uncharacterized protein (TIGR03437 family)